MAENTHIPTPTPRPPQAEQTVGSFFDYSPERYKMAFRLFSGELKQPFIAALNAIDKQDIPGEAKSAAGQVLVAATLGASNVELGTSGLVMGAAPWRSGEMDNLYKGYSVAAPYRLFFGKTSRNALEASLRDLARLSPSDPVSRALGMAGGAVEGSRKENSGVEHRPSGTREIGPLGQTSGKENVSPSYDPSLRHAIELVSHMGLAREDPLRLQIATRLAGALYAKRHPGAKLNDAAIDAMAQDLNGAGFHKVNRDSIPNDLAEGAKIGNNPGKNRSDLLLVRGVTDGLGDTASKAWKNYFIYHHTKPENAQKPANTP